MSAGDYDAKKHAVDAAASARRAETAALFSEASARQSRQDAANTAGMVVVSIVCAIGAWAAFFLTPYSSSSSSYRVR
jgi:acyl-CoA reductase-like NAD-dependent aldehyde dehydrogenase